MDSTNHGKALRMASIALALCITFAAQARGHDWWLEPASFTPKVGEPVDVAGFVGVAFRGERVARDPARIERFVLADAQGLLAVEGEPGAPAIGRATARSSGIAVVAFQSKPARLYLKAPEFEKYLIEEGLEAIVARRAERGQAQKMGLEQYSRCAKALLCVGGDDRARGAAAPASACEPDRVVGLPLELVAESDPRQLAPGGACSIRLLFEGAPLAGALVMALEREHPDQILKARTDADGRVRFDLARGGVWLVKAVHMVEAPKETRLDWESYWASLTFESGRAPAAANAGAAAPAANAAGSQD